ncbi:plasmid pRiA4b ORF-3 family protein [Noviherbaspirillum sedimenti]|uniref:plasmid pRiA4b ORF-3 family protein n=1 Tax=Noviherbaspirillum sedimenti TaxID=2320865 RepID=UPI0023676649|nr:plasmid pRiA4b ORF-3 family protein [Noviherbaspirillum sedimenti]
MSFSSNADQVRLCDLKFRNNERFIYEYDLGNYWQHEVRVEARLAREDKRTYPCCINGRRRAPPEDCGNPLTFMARRDAVPLQVADLFEIIRKYHVICDVAPDTHSVAQW